MPFSGFAKKLPPFFDGYDVAVSEDHDPKKVDASAGLFKTEMGLPWVMPVVKTVETMMSKDFTINHEELFPLGLRSFREAVVDLVLGKESSCVKEGKVLAVQTLSGSGAVKMISEIATKLLKYKEIYLPYPKWESFEMVFKGAGFPKPQTYRYYDENTNKLDLTGMLEDLENMPNDSVVVLQACCHNPTGCDPDLNQWYQIAETVMGKAFPIIYVGYQGLATGDPEEDAFPIRVFADLGIEMAIAVSFAHNFLLYNDRIGAAIFVLQYKQDIVPLKSHIGSMITAMYGSPPYHGAQIIATILNNDKLYGQWIDCLHEITKHLEGIRNNLVEALEMYSAPGNWDYIRKGRGMHTFANLTGLQLQHMILYHHVYVRKNGRMSLCGLNRYTVDNVAEAIADSIKQFPKMEDISY